MRTTPQHKSPLHSKISHKILRMPASKLMEYDYRVRAGIISVMLLNKNQLTMKTQKIYAVQEEKVDYLHSVVGIFDSLREAETFINHFQTPQRLKIVELVLKF